eukprot:10354736-Karenia_brevis.AAC.1
MLPTEQEVKEHYEMGHAAFRNWCGVCMRARPKEWDCSRTRGRRENSQSMYGIIVSQAMSLDTSGQS